MAEISNREIKAALDALSRGTGISSTGAGVTVVSGVPFVGGSESDGDLAYDTVGNNLYIFDSGSYKITVEELFFMYASAVDFTGETLVNVQAGKVTSQADVTGFTASVTDGSGTRLEWRGLFKGINVSTDPTDYVWTNVKGVKGDASIEVIITSNVGNVFKGGITSATATANVRIGGVTSTNTQHDDYKYKWTYLSNTVCVDSNRNVIDNGSGIPLVSTNGTTCMTGTPADSNLDSDTLGSSLRSIVVGTEDAVNVTPISCDVADIP